MCKKQSTHSGPMIGSAKCEPRQPSVVSFDWLSNLLHNAKKGGDCTLKAVP